MDQNIVQEKPKILIVDDKPGNLFALDKLLKKLDVEVIQAISGAEALNLALKHDFSLAIIDVQMPGMDGFELVELLRTNNSTATLPVIFVSAIYSSEYHHHKGYEAGAVDFLSKPFAPDILLSKVRVFIDLYQQRKALEEEAQQRREVEKALQEANLNLSKRALQLETSSQISQQMISLLDLDQLFEEVVSAIQRKFGYYMVSVWLLNEQQDMLVLRESSLRNGHDYSTRSFSIDCQPSIIVSVCRTGQLHLSNDVSKDPLYKAVPELTETHSELALPLRVGPKLDGVLDIQSEQLNAFDPEDVSILQILANQFTIAVRNAQLYNAEKQRR